MTAYDLLFRHGFAHLEPEPAHHLAATAIKALGAARPGVRTDPQLRTHALGRAFATPFGVAAGFDKDATMIAGLGALGFGHVEVGTLTAQPQPGNPRPRLFRLTADRALVNRMGFNNGGAAAAADRIAAARQARSRPVIGVNIGKSRVVDAEDVAAVERDYLQSTRLLAPVADYLAVNVSSPNTPGLRGLQDAALLEPLLAAIRGAAGATPVLVKIAPDLDDEQVEGIAALAARLELAGVIATNTTISRDGLRTSPDAVAHAGAGGLSGPPVAARSLAVLRLLRQALPTSVDVISVGGVETVDDVRARLAAGAALVQGYTAFIYRGPGWAREINRGLVSAS
ncbi:quinone-dependent dihydroorotate dehydrogenase [Agrococcus sp. ARC_14]|uniref:quinone-dependent dihydroorotate dehydrogenase n=1 Tax=Agrococcus sp. ARC_14 TaxID=2919927 RepID=UPI001F065176|nr:quinone-dependent dihydroorotate dehydrogenase [Agrococcus sp. ARC_14]MCH1883458.1 quinone-dependent dihydroorotate dehydrogenase [Agrococcus sp. ARC_14]